MDHIHDFFIETLSRNNKVVYYRFDIFPANKDLNISRYNDYMKNQFKTLPTNKNLEILKRTYNIPDTLFKAISWKNIKFFWVREKGKSEYNSGIHYHYLMAIPHNTTKFKTASVASLINKLFTDRLETLPDVSNPYIPNDICTLFKPYAAVRGFHSIYRTDLDHDYQSNQSALINRAIKSNTGFNKLNINQIKKRKHYNNRAIGGVFHEAIYSASYLAKLVTKTDLDPNRKPYTKAKFDAVM